MAAPPTAPSSPGLLTQEGHTVVAAADRSAALAALDEPGAGFDCVTLDLVGSAYDGIALCTRSPSAA
jgi:two-component system NtrC family sensor kinase